MYHCSTDVIKVEHNKKNENLEKTATSDWKRTNTSYLYIEGHRMVPPVDHELAFCTDMHIHIVPEKRESIVT